MTPAQKTVLDALYSLEDAAAQRHDFDAFFTAADVASAIPQGSPGHRQAAWVRPILEELWTARQVMQLAPEGADATLVDVVTHGMDAIGAGPSRLPVEQDDVRGYDGHPWERVALFSEDVETRYRSRVHEIGRLLSRNPGRFRRLPSTGLLRYVRRAQRRPNYDIDLVAFRDQLLADIQSGNIRVPVPGGPAETHPIDNLINTALLERSVKAALDAFVAHLQARSQPPCIAEFQGLSLLAALAGIYSSGYRGSRDAHIVTAGVGSGKSYSFQLPALVHAAYRTLKGEMGVGVLLVYPRVVLATNQFQDLLELVERTGQQLGVAIPAPVLDAGGRLGEQPAGAPPVRGQRFQSIVGTYQGATPILISNLDSLVNRVVHPEASEGLCARLDLVVLDEVHLLSGLYGAHSKMLLRRIFQLRAAWRLRRASPQAAFESLLPRLAGVKAPYLVGASATIAEPRQHLSRVLGSGSPEKILHIQVDVPVETGWVHHFFLRQRPESSSQTAAINALSCLVHNRRDGLYHEYYQRAPAGDPIGMHELSNPVLPAPGIEPRATRDIHKTLAFCDSLDGVNRWADLVGDNERTKADAMGVTFNPSRSVPYFAQFQEPLWRVPFHGSLAQQPERWRTKATEHYGELCRACKRGVACTIPRVPSGLTQAQTDAFGRLWDHSGARNEDSYLAQLDVKPDDLGAPSFAAVRQASIAPTIGNLDRCGFFAAGLCWWWSRDHLGSNRPAQFGHANPLNGYRKLRRVPGQPPAAGGTGPGQYAPVSGVRVRAFTSKSASGPAADSVNDIFQDQAGEILRKRDFGTEPENCAVVIGSPRLEVGIDLTRVRDGVTFRAMRDPASLQQKAGRVGREAGADSLVVHVVTDSARDHFYFRNPRIALDPDYLQPIPLHEDNRIVARNHFFMAVIDFLLLQGVGPVAQRIGGDGDRLSLINDHKYPRSFSGWDGKVQGVFDFLFGAHSRAAANLENLRRYVTALGARMEEIEYPTYVDQGPAGAPCGGPAGVVDVFRHEFGPNFFLTPILVRGQQYRLATFAALAFPPPPVVGALGLPRHEEFLRTYHTGEANKNRSYLNNILTLPLFRLGIPASRVPGNQPFLWTPNLFESVGREYVRVFRESRPSELFHEPLGLALSLLVPGTVTYRYGTEPSKVPVSKLGAKGLDTRQKGLEDVRLDTADPAWFEAALCPPIAPNDLPRAFPDRVQPVSVFRPVQIALARAWSDPMPHPDGLLADDDERPVNSTQLRPMPTAPRCFALKWYRMDQTEVAPEPIPDHLSARYRDPSGNPVPAAVPATVERIFDDVRYSLSLGITEFAWGLDRQFMSRAIDPARLVFRSEDNAVGPVVLGRHFQSPGLRFTFDHRAGSTAGQFLDEVFSRSTSPVHQALLLHVLNDFLEEHARVAPDPNNPPWAEQARPSTFVVRNLRSILLFHLLEQWHPGSAPVTGSPKFTLDDLIGCFTIGHPRYLDPARFARVCRWIASLQNPAAVPQREQTLLATREHYDEACGRASNLNKAFVRQVGEELLLNSLGLALHQAGLRLSGAESENLSYFYRHSADAVSEIYLFDSDELGNGTCDLLRRNFHVSAVERVISARAMAMGASPDPLPTTDLVECLEDALQECAGSHASHLAFHNLLAGPGCWSELDGARRGERQVAGALFDFARTQLGIASFDDLVWLQSSPEFLAHASAYPLHGPTPLISAGTYPTFQSLESACGFCVDGCISCVVSPEENIHGVLKARETVSKLLLDAFYREVVCLAGDPVSLVTYPGGGPGRSIEWSRLGTTVASALGRSPTNVPGFTAVIQGRAGPSEVMIFPASTPGAWDRVLRPDWDAAPPPEPRVRPRMPL